MNKLIQNMTTAQRNYVASIVMERDELRRSLAEGMTNLARERDRAQAESCARGSRIDTLTRDLALTTKALRSQTETVAALSLANNGIAWSPPTISDSLSVCQEPGAAGRAAVIE